MVFEGEGRMYIYGDGGMCEDEGMVWEGDGMVYQDDGIVS